MRSLLGEAPKKRRSYGFCNSSKHAASGPERDCVFVLETFCNKLVLLHLASLTFTLTLSHRIARIRDGRTSAIAVHFWFPSLSRRGEGSASSALAKRGANGSPRN